MLERSCGTVPYTVRDGIVYYLIIKARGGGFYGFPKGHVEKGETEEQTALRETLEETSLHVQIKDGFRHEITYKLSSGNTKRVVYFLGEFGDEMPRRNKGFEDFEYFLLPFDLALKRLTYESAKQMLILANEIVNQNK